MAPVVNFKDSSEDVANEVAQYIISIQNKVLAEGSVFKIAVSGGSLGKVLKKGLIENKENFSQVKWDKWVVYFSDERMVPLDHEDSNYGLFNEMVLKSLPKDIVHPKVYTIDESLLVEDGSKDAEIASKYAEIVPESIDLILLGCGPDGHTCSLFPGHLLLKETSKLIAHISDSPKPPPRRITFTFPVLKAAKNIAFVAEGAGKQPILKEIFEDANSQLPCKLVNDLGVETVWFTNTDAVKGVKL